MSKPRYTFITGRLARRSLERAVACLHGIHTEIMALDCPVAALMTTDYIARSLTRAYAGDEIIVIPGKCQGSRQPIIAAAGCEVQRGPDDLWELPRFLDAQAEPEITACTTQIVAEIVDAPLLDTGQILDRAAYYRACGADIIDLGGNVGEPFRGLKDVIRVLKDAGFRVSVDSHLREDILTAGAAGAELVLSLTSRNLELAKELACPAVVIPDDGESPDSLYRNIERLESWNAAYLADPILPPPCMGLSAGLGRYIEVRRRFPDCPLFMGLGNVTEMIDADSVGVNAILAVLAAELSVGYLLTTEASNRAVGVVKELALARELAHRALSQVRVPKHMDEGLLLLKESAAAEYREDDFRQMHGMVKDESYRIFTADRIYCFNSDTFVCGRTAGEIYRQLDIPSPSHAFYLGRELERAETALMLNKKYTQDNPLRWGYLNGS